MEQNNNRRKKSLGFRIFNALILLFIITGVIWVVWQFTATSGSSFTNNAQVKRQIVPINSRVQGYVQDIRFEEYQQVKKGDTLLIIDNSEYLLRLAQAEAAYANATAGKDVMGTTINTAQNNLSVSEANLEEVRVRLANAETNLKRYENLLAQQSVTQAQYDQVKTEYDATKARYEMLSRQKRTTALIGEEQTKRLSQTEANIRQAKAQLDIARLNLSYTVITAPCDGITGRKELQIGQLIQPGQVVATVVEAADVWVIANYKEKQTRHIAVGDLVEVRVDAVDGVVFEGEVSALAQATGSASSLVPTDNSTGNFVKIEQRIPVKIRFTQNNKAENLAKLKAGMSAEVQLK